MLLLEVQVPEGLLGGDAVEFEHEGACMTVEVPAGLKAGDSFTVEVASAGAEGSSGEAGADDGCDAETDAWCGESIRSASFVNPQSEAQPKSTEWGEASAGVAMRPADRGASSDSASDICHASAGRGVSISTSGGNRANSFQS